MWVESKKGIISREPIYKDITLSKAERRRLFKQFPHAMYIRYTSNFDKWKKPSFYCVIADGDYNIEKLPSKTRNMVRRFMKNCECRICNYKDIIQRGGYKVYLSETRRFERKGFPSAVKAEARWEEGMAAASKDGQEFWGAFCGEEVIAYGVTKRNGREISLSTWKCDYERYKDLYPSYGLVYTMTKYYLSQPYCQYVSDGTRSLTQHSHVQDFLESKFNYRRANVKLNVYFRWWVKPIVVFLSLFDKYIKNNNLLALVRMYKWSK